MRTIERTNQFKHDFKRLLKGSAGGFLDTCFIGVLEFLIADIALPIKFHDHALVGNWDDHRDCHIKPDIVLIYRKPDFQVLQLVRIGSHSDLGL